VTSNRAKEQYAARTVLLGFLRQVT